MGRGLLHGLLLLLLWRGGGGAASNLGQELKCEPIKVELCARLGYNATGMPNLMGHQLQGDAKAGLETFFPLIQYDCSPDLLFFLCSVHVPMCVSLPPTTQSRDLQFQLIGPCRPMCQRVKKLCLPVLQEFNFPWPDTLNCDKFPPANNLEHMCMDGGAASDISPTLNPSKTVNSLQHYPELVRRVKDFSKGKPELNKFDPYLKMLLETSVHNMKPAQGFSGNCGGVAYPMLHHFVNRTDLCIPKCGADILFTKEDKHFAEIWLAVWSVLCFLTTSFTLLTFLMDTLRFHYPEKCIIFLNLSYNILSLGYLIRLLVGGEGVACTGIPGAPGEPSLLVRQGLAPTAACTVVFIIIYFSSLAAAVWWAVTTTSWTLLVFANLEVKALESRSPLFHLVGWGIPAVLTISALVLHQVEGDELTGICLPGQQTEGTLLHQLIVPHSIFLGSACLFLLTGVVASLVHPGDKTRKLLARIGIFSIFYTLPQICVVGSLVYEWIERPIWRTDASKHPITEVFMMRIAMWLVVGIISGSWVWSNRTIVVWRNMGKKCCGFWSQEKKPPTPDFPRVAYRPAPVNSDTKEGVLTLEKLATLRRGQQLPGISEAGAPPSLPYTLDNNRIIL